MKLLSIGTWRELAATLESLDGWAFRGEKSSQWDLLTSLSRRLKLYAPDAASWRLREERAIRIFRRKAHNYIPDQQAQADDLRLLAIMQHHGAPTRLLDFTKSPFVATFFALENATAEAALFALDTPRLWNAAPVFDASLTRELIDPRRPGNFDRYFAPNTTPVLWFGEPAEMDRRLIAQSGLFVVPGVLHLPLDDILGHYDPSGDLLLKIVLQPGIREEAMRALYRMNITYATLFPDLDGMAKSLAYELEVAWRI